MNNSNNNENVNAEEFLSAVAQNNKQVNKRQISEEIDDDHEAKRKKAKISRRKLMKIIARQILVPEHRYNALKKNWRVIKNHIKILQLKIRFKSQINQIQIRLTPETIDIANLQKAADFVQAFICGFEIGDALSLHRDQGLYIGSFEIDDAEMKGKYQRKYQISNISGLTGCSRIKAIENDTQTRIVVEINDCKIYILGSCHQIELARQAVYNLILCFSTQRQLYGMYIQRKKRQSQV